LLDSNTQYIIYEQIDYSPSKLITAPVMKAN
jgi:hypothetical protein